MTRIKDIATTTTTVAADDYIPLDGTTNGSRKILAAYAVPQVAVFREEQTSGTNGGASTATTWTTRTLNATQYNGITGASLSTNQVTLPAGTYKVHALVPIFRGAQSKARIYNVTDASVTLLGISTYPDNGTDGDQIELQVMGVFTIAGAKAFAVQYYVTAAKTTDGLGVAASAGTEVYTTVMFEKIA